MKEILKDINSLNWTKWANREKIPDCRLSGVYILAHLDDSSSKRLADTDIDIVYIGETCGQSLLDRWRQFNRSAATGDRGHSGGRTYFDKFKEVRSNLYVAAIPIKNENEDLESATIRFEERKWLLGYVLNRERYPVCNKK